MSRTISCSISAMHDQLSGNLKTSELAEELAHTRFFRSLSLQLISDRPSKRSTSPCRRSDDLSDRFCRHADMDPERNGGGCDPSRVAASATKPPLARPGSRPGLPAVPAPRCTLAGCHYAGRERCDFLVGTDDLVAYLQAGVRAARVRRCLRGGTVGRDIVHALAGGAIHSRANLSCSISWARQART